jgi:menaquinone-specific isochorismate synthase
MLLRRAIEAETGPSLRRVGGPPLLRLEVPVGNLDPLSFLAVQTSGDRIYMRSRDGIIAVGGVGRAAEFDGLADPALIAARAAEPRLVAILASRFDPDREPAREWSAFSRRCVAVPLIDLRREADRTTLGVALGPDARPALGRLEHLATSVAQRNSPVLPPEYAPGFGALAGVDSSPDAWRKAIDATLAEIASGGVRKIVLARTRRFRLPEQVDPCVLLGRLGEGEPGTYRFLIEQQPGIAFLGASPERLFRRRGDRLESEAIAGTRPRGETPEADRALATQLRESQKERNEHALVLERIRERLGPVSVSVRADRRPHVLRLASVQHLATTVEAELRTGIEDAELLERLHPTPAVCGEPLERARTIISACEPFDRGLYAGPVGLVGATVDVCVAIRSALVVGDVVTAFAGAGVVAGSSAEAEWRETEHKLATFERIVSGPRA